MLLRLAAAYVCALVAAWPAAFVAAGLGCLQRRRRRVAFAWGMLPPLLCAAGIGAVDQHRTAPRLDAEQQVVATGWVASTPTGSGSRSTAALCIERLSLQEPDGDARNLRLAQLRWRRPLPRYGSRCRVHGRLRPARAPRNFFGSDERARLEAHGLVAVIEVDSLRRLDGEAGPAWRRHLTEPLRTRLESTLHATLAPETAAVLAALCVGKRDRVSPALSDSWRGLGLSHLLAISGMHVGLVAGGLLLVVGSPRRRLGMIALVAGVTAYAAIGGLGPAVLRAAGMTVWAALAVYMQRARRPLVGLGVVSLGLLFAEPSKRLDVGLQLSCLATFGILVWSGPLARVGHALRTRGWRGVGAAWLVVSVGVSIAAQLATLPLTLARFGYVSWLSLPANLVIVPLANTGLMLAILGAPLQLGCDTLGRPLVLVAGALIHAATWISIRVTERCDPRLYFASGAGVGASSSCLAAAALLAFRCMGPGADRRTRRWGAVVAIAASAAIVPLVWCGRSTPGAWRVEMLDVGQGDAILLAPGDRPWLIDAGNGAPYDQGLHTVVPHLRRSGIHQLRGVVITHPHQDHLGGVGAVLASIDVDTVFVAAVSWTNPAYRQLAAAFPDQAFRQLRAGDRVALGRDYGAVVLWPDSIDVIGSGANAQSLVLWATGAQHPSLLLMGDLEADGEAALLQRWRPQLEQARADLLILKVGHHGSRTSSTRAFLDATDAEVALVSVGRINRYGHPAPETLEALETHDCIVLRTDMNGAIRIEQRGAELWLQRPGTRAAPLHVVLP